MKSEFRNPLWSKILTLPFAVVSLGMIVFMIIGEPSEPAVRFGIFTVISLLMAFLVAGTWATRLTIDTEKITMREIYGTSTIYLNNIKGFNQNDKYLVLVPKDSKEQRVPGCYRALYATCARLVPAYVI